MSVRVTCCTGSKALRSPHDEADDELLSWPPCTLTSHQTLTKVGAMDFHLRFLIFISGLISVGHQYVHAIQVR